MIQCTDCSEMINPEVGLQAPLGKIDYITDRFGNKVIARVRCQLCLKKTEAA